MRAAIALFLLAATAEAGSVYLNGVKIDGVTNQKFEKATVRIDEKGNVMIDAPGYRVQQVEGGSNDSPSGSVITRHYFLVTEQTAVGMTDYDVDIYVNGKYVRKLRNGEDQIVTEVTKHLSPGANKILFVAKKSGGDRHSFSKDHVLRVLIGEGNMSGDHVMIDNPLVKFERTAADTNDVSQEFTLTTH
jgi:hypothetical protein